MTPKEKAQDLFDKFNNPETTNYPYVHNAQQCALIAVDEIMDALDANNTGWNFLYWQEVKKEIDKL